MNRAAAPSRLRVARVLRPHGVRGELRVEALGGDAARFTPGLRVYVDEGMPAAPASASHSPRPPSQVQPAIPATLVVRRARPAGQHVLVAFEGVDTPEQEAPLRGAYLCVDVRDARRLGEREWFVWQLVGMRAETTDGRALGAVQDVEEGVANDVLVLDRGGEVSRVPMVSAFVRDVDVPRGVVTIEPWQEEP
jgi:16S rRNA processing protein RimM